MTRTPPPIGPLRLPALVAVTAQRGDDRITVAARPSVPLVQVRALLVGPGGTAARLAAATVLRRPGALDRLHALGATAAVTARPDGIVVAASADPASAEALVDLLLTLLRPDGDPASDVVTAEGARLASADAVAASDPGESGRRGALESLFGPASPYADALHRTGTAPADVSAWHAAAGPILLVLCGDVDTDAGWGDKAKDMFPPQAGVLPPVRPRWSVRPRPGSAQTTLRAVAPFPSPARPDRARAELAHRLLGGGGKGSRLVRELRDRRGYGYHPGTSIVDLWGASYLLLEVDVATEVTADAVRVVDDVLTSMTDQPPDPQELELGRRGVVGDIARAFDGQGYVAELLLAAAAAGGSPAGVSALAEQVAATEAASVTGAASELLAGLHGVAVADTEAVRAQDLPSTWG